MNTKEFQEKIQYYLKYRLATTDREATKQMKYFALSLAVRDILMDRWIETSEEYSHANTREVYYLSLEFLIGRLLSNNVINLGIEEMCQEALKDEPYTWATMRNFEEDAGLGNGGLGRLAACYLDSLATLSYPAVGYGLRYDYGIFRQAFVNGNQVEEPDNWLQQEYPWEIKHLEREVNVQFGGDVRMKEVNGRQQWRWCPAERVKGIPYDLPVVGYGGKTVNTLRLWSAASDNDFNLAEFNRGSYLDAVQQKVLAENLTKVLYPNDNVEQGKELRLRQQYFFVACTLRDIFRRHQARGNRWENLPEKVFIQMNDTHPTLVVPEMMRILMDEEGMPWERAWEITRGCVGYTNHTVLPEALEVWKTDLFGRLLPRHLQIVYEINGRFLQSVSTRYAGDQSRLSSMSIIQEQPFKAVRMANLAIVGSSKVNGVAKIHSDILKNRIFKHFAEFWPDHFENVTNGITQRRWLLLANPGLSSLITEKIGSGWITDLQKLRGLEAYADDDVFLQRFAEVKRKNKERLAAIIQKTTGTVVSPDSLFDVQIKRLHEYKRQLLLTLYIIYLYNKFLEQPELDIPLRTFIFAGKAAPGYATAKLIIRLIHGVADVVNNHPVVSKKMRVVFLPDYRVSLAEQIIPAADLSEQISLAGMEASGTGNMKLMLNGAVTIGTMDGANVEIYNEVGKENIFIFGMSAEEVAERRGSYSPQEVVAKDAELRRVLDCISCNVFSLLEPGIFDTIVKTLLDFGDYYMLLADFRSYVNAQDAVNEAYRNPREWNRKALLNVARAGYFSSDRAIEEYSNRIWHLTKN